MRLSTIIGMEVKLSIYRAFILSNFNYCPVVWMLCGQGSVKKMEHIQLKALCFVFNDFTSSYAELLKKSEQSSISIHLIRSLAIEGHKCINEIAPEYLCTLLTKHNIPYDLRDDKTHTENISNNNLWKKVLRLFSSSVNFFAALNSLLSLSIFC